MSPSFKLSNKSIALYLARISLFGDRSVAYIEYDISMISTEPCLSWYTGCGNFCQVGPAKATIASKPIMKGRVNDRSKDI